MRLIRFLPVALLLAALLPAPGAVADGLDASSRDFDQLHLELWIEPDLAAGTIEGRAVLHFESLVQGLRRVTLHAEDTRVLAIVDEDAAPLSFQQAKGALVIDLAAPLAQGQGTAITIAYRSKPSRGLYFHRPTKAWPDTPALMYSQGQSNDNRRWIPCYDLPDDRMSWDIHVTRAADHTSVSNGTLVSTEPTDDGREVDHWRFEDRAPTYLLCLTVGKLQVVKDTWKDVTLDYVAVPGHEKELETALGATPGMLEFFSTYLDTPYPWSRYAQTFVWDFVYGGMENVTATTLNMRALHHPAARPNYRSEGLVAHELAHMWFGDLLTCRTWEDIWLNEGFATYLTDLYFEHRFGREEFLLRRRNQNRGYMDGSQRPGDLGLSRSPRGDKPIELSGGKAYNRGAAILHMLRLELGDDLFQKAIRTYTKGFCDRAVNTEELRRTVEEVAGRDLKWFFDQWVYGSGYPKLEIRYEPQWRRLHIKQTQAQKGGQGLFRMTLPVRFDADGPVHRIRLWQAHHVFTFPKSGQKREDYLRIGVNGDLLARISFSQGRPAWEACLARDSDVTARLDAVEALEAYGAQAVPALSEAMMRNPWPVKEKIAEVLGRMDTDPAAGRALLDGLPSTDPRSREAIFKALGSRTRGEAAAFLLEAVKKEAHDYPRAAAAHALGRVKAKGAYDVLVSLLAVDSHENVVRAGALKGLQALGDPRGAAVAAEYCHYRWGGGGAQRLRETALRCVTHLAPDARETHALLVTLLDDPHHRMRQWAADACGTYKVRSARRRLEAMQKYDLHGGVKHAAKEALKKL